MTYIEYLKSHFGEDGSLARVLQELGDEYGYWDGLIIQSYWIKERGGCPVFDGCDTSPNECAYWDIEKNLYNQSPETQRKIAELLGWRE